MRLIKLAFLPFVAALLIAGLVAPASAAGLKYGFRLVGQNTAVAPTCDEHCQHGDWISLTGLGSFDVSTGKVTAAGTFTHYSADGTVHARGTWFATALRSFTDFGGTNPAHHGGELVLEVTHLHDGMVHAGLTMTVTSSILAPAGTVVGSTVGPFTQPTGGDSVFAVL